MTAMYNALEKLRAGEALTAKDQEVHAQGLVSVLKQLHDELDAAVFDAYGWPATLTDEEILSRVVALNAARAEEERAGTVRWLRPAYQNPKGQAATQTALADGADDVADDASTEGALDAWPKRAGEQFVAVRGWLYAAPDAVTVDDMARRFKGARRDEVEEALVGLSALGLAVRWEVDGEARWQAVQRAAG